MKILDDLISGLVTDAPTREVRIGRFWTAVWSRGCGLAPTTGPGDHEHGASFVQGAGSLAERSALELARLAYSESTLEAGIGLAAINSLLEVDEARCVEGEHLETARALHDANYPEQPEMIPYIVRRGDTLSRIASRHSCITLGELADINKIRPPRYVIRIGQRLKIPNCS